MVCGARVALVKVTADEPRTVLPPGSVTVNPTGTFTVVVIFVAGLGPLFVTETVSVMRPPCATMAGTRTATARSAEAVGVGSIAAMLLSFLLVTYARWLEESTPTPTGKRPTGTTALTVSLVPSITDTVLSYALLA